MCFESRSLIIQFVTNLFSKQGRKSETIFMGNTYNKCRFGPAAAMSKIVVLKLTFTSQLEAAPRSAV